ncbi:MAG: CCA tRNA nucleotidyltransferase [Beijerinckiaceae bacterium]
MSGTARPQAAARVVDGMLIDAPFLDEPSLQRVMTCLNGDGAETRIAGGAIRNALLGEPAPDVDLATTALPEEVTRRAQAAGMKVVPTGFEHGTVTVIADGVPFEVTTLREDVETDGRRARVRFGGDFEADAKRRDFTINALFVDAQRRIHDYVGGLDDIALRRVRFIGEARVRIAEDYLRILRLFRIHAAYGEGEIDREGLQAAIACRHGLLGLSRERIGAELQKLLAARGAPAAVTAMADAGIAGMLICGVPNPARLSRLAAAEAAQGLAPDATLRLIALTVLVHEDAERLRDLLRLSNAQTARMRQSADAFAALRLATEPPPKTDLVRMLFLHGRRAAMDALLLLQGGNAHMRDDASWRSAYAFLHDTPEPRLPFSGAELMQRGVQGGPALGAMLKRLQAAWIRAGFPKEPAVLARLLEDALKG